MEAVYKDHAPLKSFFLQIHNSATWEGDYSYKSRPFYLQQYKAYLPAFSAIHQLYMTVH